MIYLINLQRHLSGCATSRPITGQEFAVIHFPIRERSRLFLMYDLAAYDGHVGGNVANSRFRHGQRIGTQDGEVGELPWFERTLLAFVEGEIGAVLGRTAERLHASDRLLGRDTFICDA